MPYPRRFHSFHGSHERGEKIPTQSRGGTIQGVAARRLRRRSLFFTSSRSNPPQAPRRHTSGWCLELSRVAHSTSHPGSPLKEAPQISVAASPHQLQDKERRKAASSVLAVRAAASCALCRVRVRLACSCCCSVACDACVC